MAAALSARCSTAVRNELPMPLANCGLTACRTGRPSSAASVASCSLPSTTSTSSKPAPQTCRTARRTSGSPPNGKQQLLRPHPRRRARREHHARSPSRHSVATAVASVVESIFSGSPLRRSRGIATSALLRQEVGDVIPAAFDYLRAHTTDEAFAHLQQHGAEARVLAGGQSLIPAMRFRLARPGRPRRHQLADRSRLPAHRRSACWRSARSRATATSSARRGSASADGASSTTCRAWSPIRSCARWARSSAACATTIRPATGRRSRWPPAPRSSFAARAGPAACRSTSFSSTASRPRSAKARWRSAREFPVPDDRTAGSYQKVERKVGDFATAAAAVQVSLNADGTIRTAGVALSAAGPCAVRVDEAEQLLVGQKPSADADSRRGRRRVGSAARRRPTCAAASNTRSIWLACSWREACVRRSRVWGCRHEGPRHGQRRRVRAGRRAAHAARVLPARRLRADRHARRLRHVELRLLRRRDGRRRGR